MYDLVIKNGIFLDAGNAINIDGIAIQNGRIVSYNPDVPAQKILDAQGNYVVPGFIDFHTHVFEGSAYGVNPDLLFSYGITTVVDQGTVGYINYPSFVHQCQNKMMKIKSFINVYPLGQPGDGITEFLNADVLHKDKLINLILENKDTIKGIKLKFSKGLIEQDEENVLCKILEICDYTGLPLCIHTTNPPCDTGIIVSKLRKGDIYCHLYQGHGNTILDENNIVKDEFWKARKRGVIMDAANGCVNFSYKIAIPALQQQFAPDIISTDLTARSFNNFQNNMARNLVFVMSKYLNLGLDFSTIIKSVTSIAAQVLKLSGEIGTLQEGALADICICKIVNTQHDFYDANNVKRSGDEYIRALATIAEGNIMFLNDELI